MRRRPLLFMSVVALGIGMVTSVGIVNAPDACAAEEIVSFKEDILPLFKWRCASCHEPGGAGYERFGFNELRRGDEGHEIRSDGYPARTGYQQFDVVGGLARVPCLAHAAR